MTDKLYELPDGWTWTTIEQTTSEIRNGTTAKQNSDGVGFPVTRIETVQDNSFEMSRIAYVELNEDELEKFHYKEGDIAFSHINSEKHVGKVALYRGKPTTLIHGMNLLRLRPEKEKVFSTFLFYFLSSIDCRENVRSRVKHAVNQVSINQQNLSSIPVPLPPLPEQRRIVARIESLFAESRTARDALERVPALLKRFRQSVLAAAFRGDLTERDPNDESASALLERVGATLCGRPELRGRATNGQPHRVAPTNTTDLPDGWTWVSVGGITENLDGRRVPVKETKRKEMQGKYPYYGASGIIDHVNDYLFDGIFLLVGEDGANLLSRSTPIAFQASGKFWVNNHAHVLQTVDEIPLAYLEHYFNRIDLSQYVTGTAQPKLTQAHMNAISVPLPPLAEQRHIVARIEALFAQADAIERAVAIARKRADKVDQAILARAFRGEL